MVFLPSTVGVLQPASTVLVVTTPVLDLVPNTSKVYPQVRPSQYLSVMICPPLIKRPTDIIFWIEGQLGKSAHSRKGTVLWHVVLSVLFSTYIKHISSWLMYSERVPIKEFQFWWTVHVDAHSVIAITTNHHSDLVDFRVWLYDHKKIYHTEFQFWLRHNI